jgi:D-alanyl-D-alanine carboxypeptidase
MASTTFADPSGKSAENVSTADDLYRLAAYLADKKSFVLKITKTPQKKITAEDGTEFDIENVNAPAYEDPFQGGKVGHTTAAEDTMLSVVSFNAGGQSRRAAVIVLGSDDQALDTERLADWVVKARVTANASQTACPLCIPGAGRYRKIEL